MSFTVAKYEACTLTAYFFPSSTMSPCKSLRLADFKCAGSSIPRVVIYVEGWVRGVVVLFIRCQVRSTGALVFVLGFSVYLWWLYWPPYTLARSRLPRFCSCLYRRWGLPIFKKNRQVFGRGVLCCLLTWFSDT